MRIYAKLHKINFRKNLKKQGFVKYERADKNNSEKAKYKRSYVVFLSQFKVRGDIYSDLFTGIFYSGNFQIQPVVIAFFQFPYY